MMEENVRLKILLRRKENIETLLKESKPKYKKRKSLKIVLNNTNDEILYYNRTEGSDDKNEIK